MLNCPSRVREAEFREAQEATTALLELLPVSARAAATEERPAAASAARQQAEAAEAAGAGRAAAAAAIPVFVVAIEAAAKSVPLGVGQLLQGMIGNQSWECLAGCVNPWTLYAPKHSLAVR